MDDWAKNVLPVLILWGCSATKDGERCTPMLHTSHRQQTQFSCFKSDSNLQFRARGTVFCSWHV